MIVNKFLRIDFLSFEINFLGKSYTLPLYIFVHKNNCNVLVNESQ